MSTDPWGPQYREIQDPADNAYEPTKDGSPIPVIGKALYVKGAGTLLCKGENGSVVDFGSVSVGQMIAFRARTIESGSTANVLVMY